MKRSLLEIKKEILKALKKEGRLSFKQLERKVNTNYQTIINNCEELEFFDKIKIGKTKQNIKSIANIPFEENKAKLLALMLKEKTKIITPQVLAEISNHAKNNIKQIDSFLLNTKEEILQYEEEYTKKETILSDPSLFRFGITDIRLLKIGNKNRTLLTGEQKYELDKEYEKLHKCKVINLHKIFFKAENLGLK